MDSQTVSVTRDLLLDVMARMEEQVSLLGALSDAMVSEDFDPGKVAFERELMVGMLSVLISQEFDRAHSLRQCIANVLGIPEEEVGKIKHGSPSFRRAIERFELKEKLR